MAEDGGEDGGGDGMRVQVEEAGGFERVEDGVGGGEFFGGRTGDERGEVNEGNVGVGWSGCGGKGWGCRGGGHGSGSAVDHPLGLGLINWLRSGKCHDVG